MINMTDIILRKPRLCCIVATLCTMGSACANAADQLTQAGRHSFSAESAGVAITTLARELEENIVYPDIGVAFKTPARRGVDPRNLQIDADATDNTKW